MKINEKNLCSFATTPPFDHEGYLNKRGEVNRAFQRRYFVLKGNLLFYFERKIDKEPLGVIIVEGCTIELCEESESYCFQLVFNGNRSYVLSAENQEIMEAWMKALTCAGYEFKKLMVADLQRRLNEIEKTNKERLGQVIQMPIPIKPPRTNPFNRPAPPLPDDVKLSNGSSKKDSSPAVSRSNTKAVLSASAFFKMKHEQLRKDVMADIQLYQASKNLDEKPLIDI